MSNTIKVLLVDDEPDILQIIEYNLVKEGYEVQTAANGREGIEKAEQFDPDLIVLDVMMPEMDGMETCVRLRENPKFANTLIIFLTARSEDYSQIAGFDSGADDYINKPIKPRVLVSRVKALIRRKSGDRKVEKEEISGLAIDREKYVVLLEGKELSLPRKEFELLALLMTKPGNVYTRNQILGEVWGHEIVVGDRTIDVHIRKLREKIGDNLIKTIKGVGYKLNINED